MLGLGFVPCVFIVLLEFLSKIAKGQSPVVGGVLPFMGNIGTYRGIGMVFEVLGP